jgi:ferric-dicitrate binding protein FerR (iron transport regulator)
MNLIIPSQAPEPALLLQALRWAQLLDTEEGIEKFWSEFETWLQESPLNEAAYHLAERIRCGADLRREAAKDAGIAEETLVEELIPPRRSTFPVSLALWVGLSTSTVLVVAVLWAHMYTAQLPWTSYSTAVGQVRKLTLEDGSQVELDTQSAVRARLSLIGRDVELERGQALFTPSHDWLRAFDVIVNQHVVRALGTRFLVDRKSDDEFQTLVAEGSVEVQPRQKTPAAALPKTVAAGEMITVGPEASHVDKLSASQVEQHLAWLDGVLDFDETLAEAVGEFNRYNKRKLIIDDRALDALPIAGRYDAHSPDLFAEDLRKSHNIYHTSTDAPGSTSGEIHLTGTPPSSGHPRQVRASVAEKTP